MPKPENLKPFKKGHKNATGRPKGSRNKSTIFKEALQIWPVVGQLPWIGS